MMQLIEHFVIGSTLTFLWGCHLGLRKLLPLWLAVLAGVLLLLSVLICCRYKSSGKKIMSLGLALFFVVGASVGGGAVRHPLLEVDRFIGQELCLFGTVEPGSVKISDMGTSFILNCTALQAETSANRSRQNLFADTATVVQGERKTQAVSVAGKVRVFSKNAIAPSRLYGSATVRGTLKPLTNFANPGGWDGETWNELHGISGRMTIKSDAFYLAGEAGLQDRIAGLASDLRNALCQAVPGQAGAVLAGMTLGGYEEIDERTRNAFAEVGLAHLLAVSGTHMALLTGFLLLVLRRNNRYSLPAISCILVAYAALCGFKPPVLRALLMSLALFAGTGSERLPQRSNIFCGVLVLLLCYEPRWLWDVGFQLSFITTAGLLYLYPGVSGYCCRWLPVTLGSILAVSLTAQLAALPFLIHYFHMLSLSGLIANLILVPFLEIAVLLVLAGFALLAFWGLGQTLFILAGLLLSPLLQIIYTVAESGWSSFTVGGWPWLCGVIYYFLLFLFFNSSPSDDFTVQERRILIGLCCCSLAFVGMYDKLRPQPLTAHFIDVGQGDAALVITPQRRTILIDTGGLRGDYDPGSRIIVPYLRYLGIRSLDMMLLSHGHHDHAGGAAAVAQAVPITKIVLPQEEPSLDVKNLLQHTRAQVVTASTGAEYHLGNTSIRIVTAPIPTGTNDANESSLIVRIADAGGSIVFTGDATEEEELLAAGSILPAQILKVSHHGSNNSSTMPFLTAVKPQIAVISVGADNSYGHPGRETLQRLTECEAKVWRTDEAGAIKVTFDAGKVKCYSYRYQKEYF